MAAITSAASVAARGPPAAFLAVTSKTHFLDNLQRQRRSASLAVTALSLTARLNACAGKSRAQRQLFTPELLLFTPRQLTFIPFIRCWARLGSVAVARANEPNAISFRSLSKTVEGATMQAVPTGPHRRQCLAEGAPPRAV